MVKTNFKIGLVGLGYVGLPLAIAFSDEFDVVGFDSNETRVKQLQLGHDVNGELDAGDQKKCSKLKFTNTRTDLLSCDFYIVAVPTPVTVDLKPDLGNLLDACELIGDVLRSGDYVVFESTVFPGATEECCVPMLESVSGLKLNKDFYCGYSPERFNPGDKARKITDICKVTSGSSPAAAKIIDSVYKKIITGGTYLAPSIKVAEASKVLENTQRDVNIALINETAILFEHLDICTYDVLDAASTKWNFQRFVPGLVGGHCISVDPYYLLSKGKSVGAELSVLESARTVNESIAGYVAKITSDAIEKNVGTTSGTNALILGCTFKENCADFRGSKILEISDFLEANGIAVQIVDPYFSETSTKQNRALRSTIDELEQKYDAMIVAVAHDEFCGIPDAVFQGLLKDNYFVFDLKNILKGRLGAVTL